MVTLKPDMTAEPDSRVDQPVVPRAVSSGEVLVLAAVVGVALLAWSGLILADVGRYTLSLAFGLALLGLLAVLAIAAALMSQAAFSLRVGQNEERGRISPAVTIARPGSIRWTDLALQRV